MAGEVGPDEQPKKTRGKKVKPSVVRIKGGRVEERQKQPGELIDSNTGQTDILEVPVHSELPEAPKPKDRPKEGPNPDPNAS